MTTFGEWKTQTARKEHNCADCGWDIYPGQVYHRGSWVFNGEWWHEKICDGCMTLRKRIWDDRQTSDDIEMHEYVYGYHDSYQIIEDKELLRFVVRHTGAIDNYAYRKEKEGDLDHAIRLLRNQLDKLREMLGDIADIHGDIK